MHTGTHACAEHTHQCRHVYMCTRMYMHTVCIHARLHAHTSHVCAHVCARARPHRRMPHVCNTHLRTCTCTRVHTQATHVCTYAHMLAHAHTRMCTHHTPHAHTLRSLTSFPGTLRPEDKSNHPREPPVTLDRVPATVPSPGGVSAPGQTHGPGGCCQRLHLFAGDPDIPGRL